jgi:TolB-like protein/DNA-binding winged helix-turn-helix (wHTH) protein/Tfp pilus assembly protein PilF
MSVADGRPHRLRFATFEVDAGSRELFRQGRKVKLQEQPFQLLVALLERPGEVLTREELKQRVWPDDTVVDFDRGLNRAINRVRDALGDSAENPRFVETLPRHGYRFIAPVQQLDLTDALPAMDGHTAGVIREPPAGPASRTRTFAGKLALLGAAAVIAVAAALLWNPGHWRDRLTAASPGPQIRSVAVLPFENLSNDPTQEYFADGITDELITDLATLNGVRVISRTSVMPYKGKRQPLPAIAGALGVDAVVEGSVARSNQRVRITAQLLLAREDRHLWAESFERDLGDILAVQRDIAAAIAREIRAHVSPVAGLRRTAINPAAYEDYLQGRFFWNRRNVPDTLTAIGYFERAIGIDPNAAAAWAGLADCYNTLSAEERVPNQEELFSKATGAAVRALEIDPNLGEAHASLGYTYLFHSWDWAGAKRELDRAVELNASDASAHDWLSHYFIAMGQFEASLAHSKTALEIDPLDPLRRAHMVWHFLSSRRYDDVISQSPRLLQEAPSLTGVLVFLGKAYERKGMLTDAIATFRKAADAEHGSSVALADLGHAYAVAGQRDRAQAVLEQLLARSRREFVPPESLAEVYCGLDDRERAMDWLEKAYVARAPDLIYAGVDAVWDPLRAEARFQALLQKLRLPANQVRSRASLRIHLSDFGAAAGLI